MSKNENLKLKKRELKEKYGNTIVRGVPQSLVANLLKNTYTPADNAFFSVRDTRGTVYRTPLMMSLNVSLENKFRYEAEIDPTWKQVIPYVVVWNENKIFCTHRLNGGDSRLTGAYSIGTGGHIDDGERVYDAMRRELSEEVGITENDIIGYVVNGYILDESSEVNSVHLGAVITMKINRDDIRCLETEKLAGEWISVSQLKELYEDDKLESWSKIVAENIIFKEYA